MSTYRVQIRVNVRPEARAALVEYVAPLAEEAGLKLRSDVPGLLEGDGLSLVDLGSLLMSLGELPTDLATATSLVGSGLVDDVWVHLTREREQGAGIGTRPA